MFLSNISYSMKKSRRKFINTSFFFVIFLKFPFISYLKKNFASIFKIRSKKYTWILNKYKM